MNPASAAEDSEEESSVTSSALEATKGSEKAEGVGGSGGEEEADDSMEEDSVDPATVFCIRLKQPRSNLQHKMSVPELCRNFSAVAWCGKLNAVACASETCARIPSSNTNPPFWIPIHIVIPERPTECAVFNVIADSPRDSVQFIEWSPTSCPRALLIANFHGRITIWTQPSQVSKGPTNLVRDASCWQQEHEWRQDIAVVTKWLSGVSPYRWLSSRSSGSTNSKSTFEEKFLSQQPKLQVGSSSMSMITEKGHHQAVVLPMLGAGRDGLIQTQLSHCLHEIAAVRLELAFSSWAVRISVIVSSNGSLSSVHNFPAKQL